MATVTLDLDGRTWTVSLDVLDAALSRYRLTSLADLQSAAARASEPSPASDQSMLSRAACLVILAATDSEYLDTAAVADALGVKASTVREYRARGRFPEPDHVDGRTPLWRTETIDAWRASRPGQGKRPAP